MSHATVSLPSQRGEPTATVRLDLLAECVARLDPATRALLDLSVRRGVRDDQMAPVLRTDPFHLAWRRARALEKVASELGDGTRPAPLGEVRMALEALPREAWGLPGIGPPALPPPSSPVEATTAMVPSETAEIDVPRPAGRIDRLDAFASESPTMRAAMRSLGRAMAAKAVRAVIWRRRSAG
jgi:hypothetical protein